MRVLACKCENTFLFDDKTLKALGGDFFGGTKQGSSAASGGGVNHRYSSVREKLIVQLASCSLSGIQLLCYVGRPPDEDHYQLS